MKATIFRLILGIITILLLGLWIEYGFNVTIFTLFFTFLFTFITEFSTWSTNVKSGYINTNESKYKYYDESAGTITNIIFKPRNSNINLKK